MALFRVGVVQCRGTPYEVGHAQARWFAATAKGRAFLRRKAIRFPHWFDIRAEQKAFATFAPAVWEEIAGIAEGLAIPMERAVLRFGNAGMRPPTGGCSAFCLVHAKGSYASIGASAIVTGRLDGMN